MISLLLQTFYILWLHGEESYVYTWSDAYHFNSQFIDQNYPYDPNKSQELREVKSSSIPEENRYILTVAVKQIIITS